MSHLRSRGSPSSHNAPFFTPGNAALVVTLVLVMAVCTLLSNSTASGALAASAAGNTPRAPLTGVVDAPQASSGCGRSPSIEPGLTGIASMVSGGTDRTYLVHLPQGYLETYHYPLVLNFHGHGNTAPHQEQMTGFSTLADRTGFIVAYPQGIVGPDLRTGWASGGSNKPRVNDVLFVSDLLNRLQSAFCIDPTRVYATGFSNGGGMTSVLACRLSGRIAAFASVAGSYFAPDGGCLPDRSVPFLEFHGTSDGTVPYNGNPGTRLIGAEQWAQTWATRDACADEQVTNLLDGVTEFAWTGCAGNAEVIHYRIAEGTHIWPGNPLLPLRVAPGDASLDASALIWAFFATHPLPSGGAKTAV